MSLQQQQQAEENNENCTGTSNWTLNASANSSRASTVCCGGNEGDELLLLKEMKLKMDTLEVHIVLHKQLIYDILGIGITRYYSIKGTGRSIEERTLKATN
jgi:hypothetical protein